MTSPRPRPSLRALKIAAEIHRWPLVCAILLDVSRYLMQTGAQALAVELLSLVLRQPAGDYETKERANSQLHAWQHEFPVALYVDGVNRGRVRTLEAVLPVVFAAFAQPGA